MKTDDLPDRPPKHKHEYHVADAKNYNVYIDNNKITRVERKDVDGGDNVLYDVYTRNKYGSVILIPYVTYISNNSQLLDFKLWFYTQHIDGMCPENCAEMNTVTHIPEMSIPISNCTFDIENIKKPCRLGEAIDCYKLYKSMTESGIKIMVLYLTKIDMLQIGTANEHILFEYICRIKEHDTLIFTSDIDADDAITSLLKNTKLCKNTVVPFVHVEQEYDGAFPSYVSLDYSAMHTQVNKHCRVSLHEVIFVFNRNDYDGAMDSYSFDRNMINFAVYSKVYYGSHSYAKYERIFKIVNVMYIPKYFSNFTNETLYYIYTPEQPSVYTFMLNDPPSHKLALLHYSRLPLYVIIDDGPETEDFIKCLIRGKKNFTIIILCDGDKSSRDIVRAENGIPQMIMYRDKNIKSILRL